MTCTICGREVLPHQCAYGGGFAICYDHGPSGYDPPFTLDRHPGVPIYAQLHSLLQLIGARQAFVDLLATVVRDCDKDILQRLQGALFPGKP